MVDSKIVEHSRGASEKGRVGKALTRAFRIAPWIAVFALGAVLARFELVPTSLNPGSIKNSALVAWVFQHRWVKTIYYALKPQLGLGWQGRFNPAKPTPALTPEQQKEVEALRAIGYMDGVTAAVDSSKVTVHLPEFAWPGFNLEADGF